MNNAQIYQLKNDVHNLAELVSQIVDRLNNLQRSQSVNITINVCNVYVTSLSCGDTQFTHDDKTITTLGEYWDSV